MKRLTLAFLLLAAPAIADDKPQYDLIPHHLVVSALNWMAQPNADTAILLYGSLQACMQNNPTNGTITRNGPDQCPGVTAAIEAREKELTDLRKELVDLRKQVAPK